MVAASGQNADSPARTLFRLCRSTLARRSIPPVPDPICRHNHRGNRACADVQKQLARLRVLREQCQQRNRRGKKQNCPSVDSCERPFIFCRHRLPDRQYQQFHRTRVLPHDLIADPGFFGGIGQDLSHPPAHHRFGLSAIGGQRLEIQNRNANRCIWQDHTDASASMADTHRHLAHRLPNGCLIGQIGTIGERRECAGFEFPDSHAPHLTSPPVQPGGSNEVRFKLKGQRGQYKAGGTPASPQSNSLCQHSPVHKACRRPYCYSTNVTLLISRSVVIPSRTFSSAASRSVNMPS